MVSPAVLIIENNCNALKIYNFISTRAEDESMLISSMALKSRTPE